MSPISSSTTSTTSSTTNHDDGDVVFGPYRIPATSVFYRSGTLQSAAFVNLRPLLPGHVLVIPIVQNQGYYYQLHQLSNNQYQDLWDTVRIVQTMLQSYYRNTTGFNIAIQDGPSAGQSVPHVHVHVIPRTGNDPYAQSDQIYQDLEDWVPQPPKIVGLIAVSAAVTTTTVAVAEHKMKVVPDHERRNRTMEEMTQEAAAYRQWFVQQQQQERKGT